MTPATESAIARESDLASLRPKLAADLRMLANLHSRTLEREDIVALWASCYDGLLQSPLRSDGIQRALNLICLGLTSLPTYLDEASVRALAESFRNIYCDAQSGFGATESAWLDPACSNPAGSAASCREWADQYGFTDRSRPRVAEDHLVVQLRLLAFLIASDPNVVPWVTVTRYLDEHPLSWIGRFAYQVRQSDSARFYKGLAALTETYLIEIRAVGDEASRGGNLEGHTDHHGHHAFAHGPESYPVHRTMSPRTR